MNLTRSVLTASLLLAATGSAGASTVFFDGIFNPSDWTLTTITNAGGAGSTGNAFQIPLSGNPLEYRLISHRLMINGAGSALFTVHMNVNAFYSPGSQGAITHINYSEDSKNFINLPGHDGQSTGLAIIQGGKIYVQRRTPLLVMPFSGFSSWAPNSAMTLLASELWELTTSGTLLPGSNPDFSVGGATMQFGFYRGNSSGNTTSGALDTRCGIDNWRVEVIPTPGALAALGLGGLLAARRRRA
jgi:hypothetical protein